MPATRETEAAGPQVHGQLGIQIESKASKYNLVRPPQNKRCKKGKRYTLKVDSFAYYKKRKIEKEGLKEILQFNAYESGNWWNYGCTQRFGNHWK